MNIITRSYMPRSNQKLKIADILQDLNIEENCLRNSIMTQNLKYLGHVGSSLICNHVGYFLKQVIDNFSYSEVFWINGASPLFQ